MTPATKAMHQTMLEQDSPTPINTLNANTQIKPTVGSANRSHAFNLHFVQTYVIIQENFTPNIRKFSKGKAIDLSDRKK
jgi:hypothetical protein